MKTQGWKAAAALLTAIVASIAALVPPALAENNPPGAAGSSGNPFYVYVVKGEELFAKGALITNVIDQNGQSLGLTDSHWYPAATETGVWQVEMIDGANGSSQPWDIGAYDRATSQWKPGRVWTETLGLAQGGTAADARDFTFHIVNNSGYLYRLDLRQYNGIFSRIRANSVGNTLPGSCLPSYLSENKADPSGWANVADCGDPYRIFIDKPDPALPAFAKMGTKQIPVLPTPLSGAELAESVGAVQYENAESSEFFGGVFSWDVTDRFSGTQILQIDTNGDGTFDSDADVQVELAADNRAHYSYTWDGLDGHGNPVPTSTIIQARVAFSSVGDVHILQDDVEGRGGIRLSRLNGDGAPDDRISWDDSKMPIWGPGDPVTTTPVTVGKNVDSSGFVHGWGYDVRGYGDSRVIDDWASVSINAASTPSQIDVRPDVAFTKTATEVTDSSGDGVFGNTGDTIAYSFDLVNTGKLAVTSAKLDDPSLSITGLECLSAPLAVGASVQCAGDFTHVITAEEAAAGTVTGQATLTVPGVPMKTSATSTPTFAPAVGVNVKETGVADNGDGVTGSPGDTISYSLTVTNTGTAPMHSATITSALLGITDYECIPAGSELAPGESIECAGTFEHTITPEEGAAKTIDHTVLARTPGGAESSDVVTTPAVLAVAITAPALVQAASCGVEATIRTPDIPGVEYTRVREGRTVTVTATMSDGYAAAPGTDTHWELEVPRVDPCVPHITLPILGDVGLPRWITTGIVLAITAAAAGLITQNHRRRFDPNPEEASENE